MVNYKFNFENVDIYSNSNYFKVLEEERKKLLRNPDDDRKALTIALKDDTLNKCNKLYEKVKDASAVVLIGIGGSNLAPLAIAKALGGEFYNENLERKFYFADTTDSRHTKNIKDKVSNHLEKGEKVVFIVASKSGKTVETLANHMVLQESFKTYQQSSQYVVVLTQEGSPLWQESEREGYHKLAIDSAIGGRYSAFSPVGILPMLLMGGSAERFLEGARDAYTDCIENEEDESNPAFNSAMTIFNSYRKRRNVVDTMYFNSSLDMLGAWKRQLLAESLGKEGKGITPITSIASTDLHSMAQLYLGGPDDKVHEIVDFGQTEKVIVPEPNDLFAEEEEIKSKSFTQILSSIRTGVESAYKKSSLPFYTIEFDELEEFSIGYYMEKKLIEVVYLGRLLDIDPFGQPNVEEYKKVARDNLSN